MNRSFTLALIALTLTGCQNIPVTDLQASPQPSAMPSAMPQKTAMPVPTASPSALPSASPEATATPSSSPSPSFDGSQNFDILDGSPIRGKIYDDTGKLVEDALVSIVSLNKSVPYESSTRALKGEYLFPRNPAGVQLAITASKPGYASRTRLVIARSNKEGDPNANQFNFGQLEAGVNSIAETALSDQPEAYPGQLNLTADYAWQGLSIRFSEPMDTSSVEKNINLYLPDAPADSTERNGYNRSHFDLVWSADDTELTMTFKSGPASVNPARIQDFKLTFNSTIYDKSGLSRGSDYFRSDSLIESEILMLRFKRNIAPATQSGS